MPRLTMSSAGAEELLFGKLEHGGVASVDVVAGDIAITVLESRPAPGSED